MTITKLASAFARTVNSGKAALTERENLRRYTAFVLLLVILVPTGLAAMAQTLRPLSGPGSVAGAAVLTGDVPPTVTTAANASAGASADAAPDVPRVAPDGPDGQLGLTQQDIDLLAHIINGEARGEPFLGQVAVGAVVLNRVRAGGEYGSTVAQVIYMPGQFEPVRNGQINLTPSASSYQAALCAAQGHDPTNGALYFWQPDRTWSSYLWSRPLKIEIGGHRFTG